MTISTYLLQQLSNLVFGGTDYAQATNLTVELWDASAETTYTGYSAQTLAVGTSDWDAAATVSGSATISPADPIVFPAPSADPSGSGDITRVRIYDDAGSPNLLWEVTLASAKTLSLGDPITIDSLVLEIGDNTTSGLSNAIELALLNHVFRGTDYTPATNLYFDIYDDGAEPAVTDGSGGTLTDYGSYSQQAVTNNTTNFPNATVSGSNVVKALGAAVTFPTPTSNATNDAGAIGIWAETGRTNLIATGPITAKPLQTDDTVSIPTATVIFTFQASA